jgi:hypothetical protein
MDRPTSVEGLVVAVCVDGQGAEQLALLGHHADISAGDEEKDRLVGVSGSDADVAEAAAIAQGDGAGLVDAVATDAVLDGSGLSSRSGLDSRGERLRRRPAIEGAVRTRLVVIETEGIELGLKIPNGALEAGARESA